MFDYKESMKKAESNLIDDLSKRDFIVFAGTGAPETTGVKLWEKILIDLDEKQTNPDSKLNIKAWDPYEYPELAQILYGRYLRKNETQRYYNIIKDNIQPTKEFYSQPQRLILCLSQKVVTTNYDDTFEKAFEAECINATSQTLPALEYNKIVENSITYLHGKFSRDSTLPKIIFKTEDYAKYYPMLLDNELEAEEESCVEKILRSIYESKTALIFWGFSFGDRFVEKTLSRIYGEIKERTYTKSKGDGLPPQLTVDDICHYAIMPYGYFDKENLLPEYQREDEKRQTEQLEKLEQDRSEDERLRSKGINVVRQEMYKDIIPLIEEIARKRGEIKSEMKSLIKPEDDTSSM